MRTDRFEGRRVEKRERWNKSPTRRDSPKKCGGSEESDLAIDFHHVPDIECGLVQSQVSRVNGLS